MRVNAVTPLPVRVGLSGARRGTPRAVPRRVSSAQTTSRRARRIPGIEYHLAQLNIGMAKGPIDGDVMAGFRAALGPVNSLADAAPGFVWRLQTAGRRRDRDPSLRDERMIVNMSVWESIEALRAFVYSSGHTSVMRNRKQWFEKLETYLVLWWVPVGHEPTIEEAKQRLDT